MSTDHSQSGRMRAAFKLLIGSICFLAPAAAAFARGPVECRLSGKLTPSHAKPSSNGIAGVGDFVRVRLDANGLSDCMELASNYCRERKKMGFAPGKLQGFFRSSPKETQQAFAVYPSCEAKLPKE